MSLTVELAFGSGYSTAAVDRDWTDISDLVVDSEGVDIAVGRGDERSVADANTFSLTLDNSSGDFTPGLASGAYYPDVKIGTPIRITVTPDGGTDSVRGVGFVEEWAQQWDGSDESSDVVISATSRFTVLGRNAAADSLVRQTILMDAPTLYYPLTEAAGASLASDASGNGNKPLGKFASGADVYFGTTTGAAVDGGTCVEFFGERYLRNATLPGLNLSTVTVEVLFATSTASGVPLRIAAADPSSPLQLEITHATFGQILVHITDAAGVSVSFAWVSGYMEGDLHHFAVAHGSSSATLYIDGAAAETIPTAALAGSLSTDSTEVEVGRVIEGTQSHVAIFESKLTADQIAAHAEAALTQFAGETAGERIERYATWANAPIDTIDVDAGEVTLTAVDTTGAQILDLMRQAETSEGGVLFDAPDGALTFRSRSARYVTTPDLTLDFGSQQVGADFSPRTDRASLLNDVTVVTTDGTNSGHSIDTTSRDQYGPSTAAIETQTQDESDPQIRADWTTHVYAEPIPRVSSLTVEVLLFTEYPSQNDVLDVTVGSLICCTNQPSQCATSTGYYFVEGYTENIAPNTHTITFNVSPADAWMNVVHFDDDARGFDSGAHFAY